MADSRGTTALVAAAGKGARMGAEGNKVFLPIAGAPILAWTLAALSAAPSVRGIVVVCGEGEEEAVAEVARRAGVPCRVVPGGATRAASVRAGLAAADPALPLVAIHDAARPFATPRLIERCADYALAHGATGAALPVTDTVKVVDETNRVTDTPSRAALRAMQTPQTFLHDRITRAYESVGDCADSMTDDCEVAARAGFPVVLCEGERENVKITYELDLAIAEAIARGRRRPGYSL